MLIDDYYKLQRDYTDKYGEKTIVFMQVGSFYESYSSENKNPDLSLISEILNIVYTKKDKSKDDSPYMLGFPVQMIHKYVRKLINQEYTVVLYKQIPNDYNRFDRILEGIYTPSTYTEDIQNKNNYMCGLYLEKSGLINSINYHIGLTYIDVSTGDLNYIEEHFNNIDLLLNYIHSLDLEINPKEYIMFYDENNIDNFETLICSRITKKYTIIKIKEKPLQYQIEFFKKVYSNSKLFKKSELVNILDYLDLTNFHISRESILNTLEFCYSLNSLILNHIKKPKLYRHNTLVLGNDAISQLNIIDNNNLSVLNNNYKSVFDVINNCITPMGKRFLFKKIVKPNIIVNDIEIYYKLSDEIYPLYNILILLLKKIKDIEKLGRKIMMNNVSPNELFQFYSSMLEVHKLSGYNIPSIKSLIDFDLNEMFSKIIEMIDYMNLNFYVDVLNQYNSIKDIKNNFIKDSEIQNIIDSLNKNKDVYEETVDIFVKLLNDNEKSKKTSKLDIKDSKEGKYIHTTNLKGEKIYNYLDKNERLKYDFKKMNKICKIFINNPIETKIDSNDLQNKLNTLVRKKYFFILENMEPFFDYFYLWNELVSTIDFGVNNCILKDKLGYSMPIIDSENKNLKSYIDITEVRHPVIEKIINSTYIPNSINMNNDKHILLFGLNSAGKSSFQKSLGISIILAQSGVYVPAKKMIYKPYNKLYVRITGNDNIFKGLSSFAVEMTELNTILQNSDKNTLVIGDELSRGTENISAISIVASSLNKLVKMNTSFIFATHFSEILDLKIINELNLSYYYMDVEILSDKLIYNRILKKGKYNKLYGLIVAKNIIQDTHFIKIAEDVSREIQGSRTTILNDKKSRYNSTLYLDECMLCQNVNDKELETHHIEQQKDCDKYKSLDKPHIHKNSKANLIVLCNKCHDKIHSNNIKIIKKETSNGIEIKLD